MSAPTLGRVALALLQIASVAALGARLRPAWVLALAGLLCLRLDLALPAALRAGARGLARYGLLALVAFGVVWVVSPQLPDALAPRVGLAAGLLLASLAALLVLDRERAAPGGGLLEACLGAFLAAALDPQAVLDLPLALGFVALVLSLASAVPWRAPIVTLFSVCVASGLAYGLVVLLPWAQPQVEAAAARAAGQTSGLTGFGPSAPLGELAALGTSQRTALRVYADAPALLRGQVLERFDGRSWSSPPAATGGSEARYEPLPGGGPPWLVLDGSAAPRAGLRYRIHLALDGATLFLPARSAFVRASSGRLSALGAGLVGADEPPAAYEALALAQGSAPDADAPCGACLALPAHVDARVVALAAELGANRPPEARVARTLAYFERGYRYTLEPGAFRAGDPLAEFLFEKRAAYCSYFASAAALLLRLEGLETRYVKGFNLTPEQRVGDHYLVPESAAHAWIEVRLPGRGWREYDPTPAAEFARVHAAERPGFFARGFESLRSFLERARAWLVFEHASGLRPGPALALVALAALALLVLRRLRLARAPRAGAGPGWPLELEQLVRLLDAGCARHGHARPRSRGLVEHLRELPPGSLPEDWRARGLSTAERVYAAAYGARPASAAELRALGASLRER